MNVLALVGDNCSINRSISNVTNIKFIGSASHRFKHAVKELLSENEKDNTAGTHINDQIENSTDFD